MDICENTKKARMTGGVIVPVITPVDVNEDVDEKAYRAVIRRCLSFGVDGIFAGGSAGMGPLLTDCQWQKAMEIAIDEVGDEAIVMGGVIATSTRIALQKIEILNKLNYPTMVVTPTYYISLSQKNEMLSHFEACQKATDMQMIVYNIPGCVGSNIPVEIIEEMASLGWTDLIKESSGNRDYFERLLESCSKYNVGVMQGNEPDIEWGLSIGAAGIVPVCANYEPQTFVTAVNAAKRNDRYLLGLAQQRASEIREGLGVARKNWIAGIMYGVRTLGIGTGVPLMPLQELNEEEKMQMEYLSVVDICNTVENV